MAAALRYFITGTDTGIGKTRAALGLLHALAARGLRVAGMKPVASGAQDSGAGLHNDDALQLQAACSAAWPYAVINPCVLEQPAAPHLAARAAGLTPEAGDWDAPFRTLCAGADAVVVEGVGGWRVPLTETVQTVDLVRRWELSVMLVVGMRLGCISHALLTMEALQRDAVPVAGWIANHVDGGFAEQDSLGYLRAQLPVPLLAHLAHGAPLAEDAWQLPGDAAKQRI